MKDAKLNKQETHDLFCRATDWLCGKMGPAEAAVVEKELANPNSKISMALTEINEAVSTLRSDDRGKVGGKPERDGRG